MSRPKPIVTTLTATDDEIVALMSHKPYSFMEAMDDVAGNHPDITFDDEGRIEQLLDQVESALSGNTFSLTGLNRAERLMALRGNIEGAKRLQQLREEFEAAHAVYAFGFNGNGQEYSDPDYIARWPHEWWPGFKEKRDMVVAARHYIIARDFGEFDRKRALMLWKLQNNN